MKEIDGFDLITAWERKELHKTSVHARVRAMTLNITVMRTKRRHILRGFMVGGLLGLAISISLLVLAFAGLEIKPLIEVVFAPAGVVMLAMKGDNWPGSEPLFVHYLALIATVAIHALVGAGAGAVVSTVMYGRRPASTNSDETA